MSLLPLFPLDLVLLPGVHQPLHIFEPRYKEMIAECIEQKKPFGIVRAADQGVAAIGCTAEIVSVTKKYDDGRMDILTRGVRRFEVIEMNQDRSFLQAEITMVEDEPGEPAPDLVDRTVRLYKEIARLAGADSSAADAGIAAAGDRTADGEGKAAPEGQTPDRPQGLSFLMAGSLPLDLDFKQNLLSTLSEVERLEHLAEYLQAVLPGLRRAARARWN